jgi:hypothetical protein
MPAATTAARARGGASTRASAGDGEDMEDQEVNRQPSLGLRIQFVKSIFHRI